MNLPNGLKKLTQHIRSHVKVYAYSVILSPLVISLPAFADPTGESIVGGAAHVTRLGLNTNIHQHTDRLAIDWETFNIEHNESVNFDQPGQSSIVLNRIRDINPSRIKGAINANGQVVIVNPNGVIFSSTATVNAAGLFASALDINPDEFMQNNLSFSALENTSGLIVNEGELRVIDGGTLALMGKKIINTGLLVANFGMVNLTAANSISVTFDEYDNVSIGIKPERLAGILQLDSVEIFNSGLIEAYGGRVVLTTRQANEIKSSLNPIDESKRASQYIVQDGVVYFTGSDGRISDLGGIDVSNETGDAGRVAYNANNIEHSGTIKANSQNGDGGSVTLTAKNTSLLTDNSTISAQSSNNGSGGKVQVLGNQVGLTNNASINASGTKGGGEVLIGGDYQGRNETIQNAEAVYVGKETTIKADAIENGDGGKVIVWSDARTRAYGSLSATGGKQNGNGGLIETSSKNYVDLQTRIDVSASNGQHGEWLIDPSSISITGSSISGISTTVPPNINFTSTSNASILDIGILQDALANGANITIQTSIIGSPDLQLETSTDPNNRYGDITLSVDLDYDNAGTTRNAADNASSLTLLAHRNIIIDGRIFDSDGDNTTNPSYIPDGDILNLTLVADWDGNGGANQSGTAGRGDVRINNDIILQGGNFSASGVNYTQSNTANIDTRLPALTANSGFNPDTQFGIGAPTPDGSVTIIAQNNATLGNINTRPTTGTLNVSATGGAITGTGLLDISGATNLTAAGNITLDNTSNNFNAIPVEINNGAIVELADANNLTVNINNSLVTRISTNTGGDVIINDMDINGTALGAMTVGGNLDVNAAGSITTAGIVTINNNGTGNGDGISRFAVPDGSNILLTNNNNLNGTLNFIANTGQIANVTVVNNNAFNFQNGLNITGNLNLRTLNQNLTLNNFTLGNSGTLTLTADNGDIVQNNAINHSGATILSASGNIFDPVVANNPVNNLANVQINNATTASINNGTNAITLNGVTANDLNIISQGGIQDDITQTNAIAVTNTSTFDAGSNALTLNNNTHSFNNVQITAAGNVQINETDNINIAGNMASLNVTSGLGGGVSVISNIEDLSLNVTGTTDLTLENGGSINLANFTGALQNNLQSIINIAATTGSMSDALIRNTSDIQLGSVNLINNLNLSSNGNILQTGSFIVNGTSTLQANNITLTQNNNFVGDVTITNSNVVQLNDNAGDINIIAANTNNNTIDLTLNAVGAVGIEGELNNLNITTNTNNIQNTAALLVSNNTTLDAGATGNINFQNNPVNLQNVNITQANSVQINDADNLNITSANVNGAMDITASGAVSVNGTINTLNINTSNAITLSGVLANLNAITTSGGIQNGASGLSVTGNSLFDATNSDINLNHAANDFNNLQIVNAQDVTINDANAVVLQDINTRDFNLTSAGNVTQSASTRVTSTRDANINAGNANILLEENNLFNTLGLTANAATIVNNQALTITDSVLADSLTVTTNNGNVFINQLSATNNINLNAADALVDINGDDIANIITNTAILNAANGIGMNSSIDTQVAVLDATNRNNGDINIKNTGGDITLNNIFNGATDTGNFNFESTNDVFINRIELQQNLIEEFFNNGTGTVNIFTADGSFLGLGDADINNPDITATNLRAVGFRGTLGTIQRPLVLDISGKVEIIMRASLDPVYVTPVPAAEDIRDESILQFTSFNILSTVNGLTLTEVENLLDIDPAIFTDIRHYVVSEPPVFLPKDQRFEDGYTDEEDDEFFKQVTGTETIKN